MKMKKNRLILSGLAIALLGASAAVAAPHMPPMGGHGPRRGGPGMPPPPHAMQRDRARIPENAPEEIKNAYKEMRSLRKDLNLELRKDKGVTEAEARKAGLLCIIMDSDDSYAGEVECVELLESMHVEGVILSLSQETTDFRERRCIP